MVMAARGTSISADDHVKELNVIASETNALFDPAVTSHNETADPTVAVQGKLDEHADRDDELEDTPWIPLEVSLAVRGAPGLRRHSEDLGCDTPRWGSSTLRVHHAQPL
jgi:hypothetical protein